MPTMNEESPTLGNIRRLLDRSRVASVEKAEQLAELRKRASADEQQQIDMMLLREIESATEQVSELKNFLVEQKDFIDRLTSPPLYPATFLGAVTTGLGSLAKVQHDAVTRLVRLDDSLDIVAMNPGDEIYLNHDRNLVLGVESGDLRRHGETATVERLLPDGRIAINDRDMEVLVGVSGAIDGTELKSGDLVRWNRQAMLALERVEQADNRQHEVFEVIRTASSPQLAGCELITAMLIPRFILAYTNPDLAVRYHLVDVDGRLLLIGPPGCGKTTAMRVIGGELHRQTGLPVRVVSVKGAELFSSYVGQTELNIRRQFRLLADYQGGPAILFIDEIDAIGHRRGLSGNIHSDRFLNTLLAELEGLDNKDSGIMVIAATNRPDVLDPALRERFGTEIVLPRPGMRAAREILHVHLSPELPYRFPATQEKCIELAVEQLYLPNAGNQVATLRFRDGAERMVTARELVSGRLLEQISRSACQAAFHRHAESGGEGLMLDDMETAVAEAIDRLSTILSPRNAASYLDNLPQDLDVVAVDPIRRRVRMPGRYLRSVGE